ncbi:MAG TPA: CarD family transcriptional regulator, partial [Pyrinomonadaceae bacterium]
MSTTIHTNALQHALRRITETPEFRQVVDEIKRGGRTVSISGLVAGSARALALATLQRETGKHFAVVTQSNRDLEPWEGDLRFWYCALAGQKDCENEVLVLPSSESDPYAGSSPHPDTLERRALTLWRLARHSQDFVLLTTRALARRTVTPEEIMAAGAVLTLNDTHPPDELVDGLVAAGYVREDPVGAVGEFSMRGGILDVWSPGQARPVRIEFFGDEIDSIRAFDPETQLSTNQLKSVEIVPRREVVVRSQDFSAWANAARERWSDDRYARALRDRTVFADEGESFAGWEWLLPVVRERRGSVFDYLKDAVLVIDEPSSVEGYLGEVFQTLADRFAETDAVDDLAVTPEELYLSVEELRSKLEQRQRIELRVLGRAAAELDQGVSLDAEAPKIQLGRARKVRPPMFLFPVAGPAPEIEWKTQSTRKYHGRLADLAADLVSARDRETQTLLVMPSLGVAERVAEILAEYNIEAQLLLVEQTTATTDAPETQGHSQTIVTVGRLSSGFGMPDAQLLAHIEADLFDEAGAQTLERRATGTDGRRKTADGKKKRSRTAAFLSDFRDLKAGDFVVHIDHGIGRFGGLQTLDLGTRSSEFMLLFYAEDAKLYVPVERLDLVQRYSSGEGQQPTLDRLGGLGWQKTKAKAKRAMRDMADELLRLYAERKLVGGYAFAADTPWQQEFEDGFEYVLTPDQETAIEDVKQDMEQATPMDRLLCGDVDVVIGTHRLLSK